MVTADAATIEPPRFTFRRVSADALVLNIPAILNVSNVPTANEFAGIVKLPVPEGIIVTSTLAPGFVCVNDAVAENIRLATFKVAIEMVPAPLVTDIPSPAAIDAATGFAPVEPTKSCPLVRAAASTIAPPLVTTIRLLFSPVPEFVPPDAMGSTPVTCEVSDTAPVVKLRFASVCKILLAPTPETLTFVTPMYPPVVCLPP